VVSVETSVIPCHDDDEDYALLLLCSSCALVEQVKALQSPGSVAS